ncbi:MAG: TlpA disulfide reductase family protein [Erysipelotrichaceae bacterium]
MINNIKVIGMVLIMLVVLGGCRVNKADNDVFRATSLGDFSALDFDGNTITKDVFKDYDLTMVNLWVTNCGYCIDEMPVLNTIRDEVLAKGVNIISICMDVGHTKDINNTNYDIGKDIVKKTKVKYLNLIPDSLLLNGYLHGLSAFPQTFFVDKEGYVISEAYIGSMTKEGFMAIIEKQLGAIKNLNKNG